MGKTTRYLIKILVLIVPILHGCTNIQYATPPPIKKCPACNKLYSEGTKFCSEDGTKLADTFPLIASPQIPTSTQKSNDQKQEIQDSFSKKEPDGVTRFHHMENYLNTLINAGGTEAQIMSCRRMLDELKNELSSHESKETSYVDMLNTEPVDDDILIHGTISYVTDLIVPPYDVKITYDKKTRSVYVKFRTPVPYKYKYDYSDVWDRWRFNQWIVLQEFKKAKIPVSEVTVETNHDDGSGIMKITHSAEHIEKYAKLADENLWLRTGTFYQKEIGSDKWERIDN